MDCGGPAPLCYSEPPPSFDRCLSFAVTKRRQAVALQNSQFERPEKITISRARVKQRTVNTVKFGVK